MKKHLHARHSLLALAVASALGAIAPALAPEPEPDLTVRVRVGGEYMAVLNQGTDREFSTGWQPNMVLDQGLDYLGEASAAASLSAFCSVGTSSTAVAAGQTSLVAFLAATGSIVGSTQSNLGAATYKGQGTLQYQFVQGAVIGNITEMGIGKVNTGAQLFSRCLIIDGAGTPVALPVTSIDQLTIYYRVTVTPVLTDLASSVTISAVAYSYTARLANAANFADSFATTLQGGTGVPAFGKVVLAASRAYDSTSALGAITTTPSGTNVQLSLGASTSTRGTYTNGNFYCDNTLVLDPTAGNATGGIGALMLAFSYGAGSSVLALFQYKFATVIPKDNTKTLTLVTRFAWSR